MSDHFTILLSDPQVFRLQGVLEGRGFEPRTVPYARYSYTGAGVVVTVYEKRNKLLVQGSGLKDFMEFTLEPEIFGEALFGSNKKGGQGEPGVKPHFGIDESGKGDYFGPLVIGGVYVDAAIASQLMKIGVCDSKLVSSSAKIRNLAAAIRDVPGIAYEIIRIGPERYNEIYPQFGNLNRMLAWGHARVIEVLMKKVPSCRHALSDQFARASVLESALSAKKLDICLEQRTKAESDLAVAAASILARERFVDWMDEASERGGVKLPLGASAQVVKAGREVIEKYGEEMLGKVAKLHFKTTAEVMRPA